jgi:AraC-like DNA-binding protein
MDYRVERLLSHIRQNPRHPWRARELAALAGLSDSHLRHIVRTNLGTSLVKYLLQHRLGRARELLHATDLSVKEVMVEVGLRDMSHFVRDFERAFGLSPRRYRRAHRSEVSSNGNRTG